MAIAFCGRRILLTKSIWSSPVRTSYIVLVPEIGEDLPDKNPLLDSNGLPEFNNLTIEKCVATIAKQTNEFEGGIRQIEESISTSVDENPNIFETVIDPIETNGTPLDTTWGLAKTMYVGNRTLMPTKSYLTIHERARRARSTKFNSKLIYKSCKNYLQKNTNLPEEKSRVLNKFVLEGKLNGLDLSESNNVKFIETLQKLNKERSLFKDKLEVATKQFSHVIRDYHVVREFPNSLLKSLAVDSSRPTEGPWKVTLQPAVVSSFLEHCPDRDLRWNVWQANVRRASGSEDKELQTSTHLEEIRYLRNHIAKLLGYANYAQMSMETKMMKSVEGTRQILKDLLTRARPTHEEEFHQLESFAAERGFDKPLQHWDIPFWKRKQEKALFDFDEDKLREYFPLPVVLQGLFSLCEKLFAIQIRVRPKVSTWHSDVKYFDIFEANNPKPIAGFYLDPYSREEQKLRLSEDSGYVVAIRNRSSIVGVDPLAALVFNFQSPAKDVPSLLSFREVKVLFTKFGHALQHLLTRANYSEVSGLSNVEWDAVDICGNVLLHWLYDQSTIRSLTAHYASGEQMPSSLITNLTEMRSHFAGTDLCHELYLANLDLDLHSASDFWLDVVKKLWSEYHVLPLDKRDAHVCSFAAIFSDEWGAAYYSKIWSRLVAADVYSAFHEVRGDDAQTQVVGQRFRDTFLALGGASHPSQVFRRFRGRDPSPKALMRILNLKKVIPVENSVPVIN